MREDKNRFSNNLGFIKGGDGPSNLEETHKGVSFHSSAIGSSDSGIIKVLLLGGVS